MTRLLQVSDAHFGTERDGSVEALVRLHAALAPELVVLSGDLTQRATAAQFAAARELADEFARAGSAVFSLAGNHDVPLFALWTRLLAPYRRYRRRFGSEAGFVHEDDALVLVGLNSTRHTRHKDGEVDAAQVERVAAALESGAGAGQGDGRVRAVVMHHPVHAIRPQDEENLVHGGEAAVRRWAEAGVDLVIGGHVHLPYVSPLAERYAGLASPVWAVQAGTALSRRTRGGIPNSVNLIETAPERHCRVERWDFEAGAREFRLHGAETLALDERRPARAADGPVDPLQPATDVLAPGRPG